LDEADRHLEPHQFINIRYEYFATDPLGVTRAVLNAAHSSRLSRQERFLAPTKFQGT
jgi:hypothetical protein